MIPFALHSQNDNREMETDKWLPGMKGGELPRGTNVKESTFQCRRQRRCRFDPWVGEIPREGNGNPLQYSCLKNPMNRNLVDYSPWSFKMSNTTEVT